MTDTQTKPLRAELKQQTLADQDPEIFELLQREETRQWKGLELIASENFTSRAVMETLGTVFTNKYSEGLPGARYYGGNEYIDQLENLCIKRSLAAFGLDEKAWGINVQPYSGSTANFAAYTGILQPHDRIMGLDMASGGHLTHGHYTPKKKITASSLYFESLPYKVHSETGYVDYNLLEERAELFRPKLIICGGSAYPREWDYARIRQIADKVDALMMVDMAHFAGLVAAGELKSPFEFAHIVTTTTHKTLRGPRAGLIFFSLEEKHGFKAKINGAVFPATQGGPHNNAIAAIAVQMKEVATPEWKEYAKQVRKNAVALGEKLKQKGYKLATDGTDNHLLLLDLRPKGIGGGKVEAICDAVSITLNKNTVHGDKSAFSPGGVRIGTPALTSRGFKETDFQAVGEFLDRAVQLAIKLQGKVGGAQVKLEDFKKAIPGAEEELGIKALREEVEAYAKQFPMPGYDVTKLKYQQ